MKTIVNPGARELMAESLLYKLPFELELYDVSSADLTGSRLIVRVCVCVGCPGR